MNQINQAIITLGGKGTRLESITKGIPKPLYPIQGESTLERAIQVLKDQVSQNLYFLLIFCQNYLKYLLKNFQKVWH